MKRILYTEKQASIAAFLAGPIPPGILIYLNYKALGNERAAYITLAVTLMATALLFYGMMSIPEQMLDKIPGAAVTAVYGAVVFLFFRQSINNELETALEEGTAEKGSNWTVAGVSLIGLIIAFGLIFLLSWNQPFYEGNIKNVNGNELYYDANVTETDVSKLSGQLVNQDYFGQDYGSIARLQLSDDQYYITLAIDEAAWSDPVILNFASYLRATMAAEFGKQTFLKFESVSLSGKSSFRVISE
ncbi:MAG: hypothetical protein AAFO69_03740 [Bacteroidota bacterium]